MGAYIALVVGYILIAVAYVLIGRTLAAKHSHDVRVVTYVFSLSGVVAAVVAYFAIRAGAMDRTGHFVGHVGNILNSLLNVMLDLPADLALLVAGLVIALVPQFFSYILSVAVKCARTPLLVGFTLRVFLWLVVKSFAAFGGVIISLSILAAIFGWPGLSVPKALFICWAGSLSVILAMAILLVYRDTSKSVEVVRKQAWYRCMFS